MAPHLILSRLIKPVSRRPPAHLPTCPLTRPLLVLFFFSIQGAELQDKAGAAEPRGAGSDEPPDHLFVRPRHLLHGEGPVCRVDPAPGELLLAELSCPGSRVLPCKVAKCLRYLRNECIYFVTWS